MPDTKVQPGQLYEVLPDGRWAIFLDATMTGSLGVCPQMFHYRFVQSIKPKGEAAPARDLGSWWSAVMEEVYARFAKEQKLDGYTLVQLATSKWAELRLDESEKISPKKFKEFGGIHGAIQMICEYADRQLPIDYLTWKIIAAEASFGRNREVCVGETDKIVLYWMGQPDLAVASQGRLLPVDHKSVEQIDANLHKKWKPNIQLPGYIIAMQVLCKSLKYDLIVDRCIVNICARRDITKRDTGEKRPRFMRIPISFSPEELEEWRRRVLRRAEQLRWCFENNEWAWNEYACQNQFYRPCPYRNIDSKPPGVRDAVRQADYVQVEPWIPGRTRHEAQEAEESAK